MRLQQYLLEKIDHDKINWDESGYYDDIANQIKVDCKAWLKESKGLPGWRGITMNPPGKRAIVKRSTRKNRAPLDTSQMIHDAADKVFKKLFGWKARSNVVFVQGNVLTLGYSVTESYALYPIGKYKYLWSSQIADFTLGTLNTQGKAIGKLGEFNPEDSEISSSSKFIRVEAEKILTELIKTNYKNKGLHKALTMHKNNEIMVGCKKYYIIPYSIHESEIKPRL